MNPSVVFGEIKKNIKGKWVLAFMATFCFGLLVHMPILLSDIPNHDGLASMYFNQDMITSGRWFLTIACGISSYYTIPWVIGVLGLIYLGLTSVLLTEILDMKDNWVIVISSGLLAAFPSLASTFAYVFTLDGYMLGLFLAVLAVFLCLKFKYGFIFGMLTLCLALGTYQAYVAVTIILCLYLVVIKALTEDNLKVVLNYILRFVAMGIGGFALYMVLLRLLLKIRSLNLDTYQGISSIEGTAENGLLANIKSAYLDFITFSLKGRALFDNAFGAAAVALLILACLTVSAIAIGRQKLWKKAKLYIIIALALLITPICFNAILLINSGVNYHLLMRYQWAFALIILVNFGNNFACEKKPGTIARWVIFGAGAVLVFTYALQDNIAYSNLQKKYEKTYAYCVRLLDRIEQTEGYYQGIPIAMEGWIGEDEYPATDITSEVTGSMIGMSGDYLIYKADNYEAFMKNYLGATLNFLPAEEMSDIYYSDIYEEMDSFPHEGSIKIVDGIMYIKTENKRR